MFETENRAILTLIQKPDEEPTAPQDTTPFPGDGYLGTATAPEALCPGLHGKIKSVNGKNYRMYCGVATLCNPATSDIRTPYPVKSLDECLADCANDSRCASMNFLNTDRELYFRVRMDNIADVCSVQWKVGRM